MKLVAGRTLADVLRERTVLPVAGPSLERLLQIVLKVCDAVRPGSRA